MVEPVGAHLVAESVGAPLVVELARPVVGSVVVRLSALIPMWTLFDVILA